MADDEKSSTRKGSRDARAAALAHYLRQCAAAFSMSSDVMDVDSTAVAGMALLDAAAIADSMTTDDPRIKLLSEAGLFESMPDGEARFLPTPEIRAAIQRPLVSTPQAGSEIITELVATAARADEPPEQDRRP